MYPEDVYTLHWMLPRELSRPIAFNLARGLIQDKLILHKMVREISIDEYRSYHITSGDVCWWVVIDGVELHCILMSDLFVVEETEYLMPYSEAYRMVEVGLLGDFTKRRKNFSYLYLK